MVEFTSRSKADITPEKLEAETQETLQAEKISFTDKVQRSAIDGEILAAMKAKKKKPVYKPQKIKKWVKKEPTPEEIAAKEAEEKAIADAEAARAQAEAEAKAEAAAAEEKKKKAIADAKAAQAQAEADARAQEAAAEAAAKKKAEDEEKAVMAAAKAAADEKARARERAAAKAAAKEAGDNLKHVVSRLGGEVDEDKVDPTNHICKMQYLRLKDDDIIKLAGALDGVADCASLQLSSNKMTAVGAKALGAAIGKNRWIDFVDIGRNKFGKLRCSPTF